MLKKIANYSKTMAEDFPFWSKIRDNPLKSIAFQFLNVFGFKLDDAEEIIKYTFEQNFIDLADEEYISYVYRSVIPINITESDLITIKNHGVPLDRCKNFEEFYVSKNNNVLKHISKEDPFVVDYENNMVYFSKEYNSLQCVINEQRTVSIKCVRAQVWNMFDELGSLVSLERRPFETNTSFKERIKDVYVHKPSSTTEGLINSLSRELALRKNIKWEHPTLDFTITDKNVLVNSISIVDSLGQTTKPNVFVDEDNNLVIEGRVEGEIEYYISYARMFSVHDINNTDDYFIRQYYYNPDKTSRMNLVNLIRNLRTNKLDGFTWDQTYEQPDNKKVMPNKLDSSISGFAKYNNLTIEDVNRKVKAERRV